MADPMVCAVMLVNGRAAMVRAAIESFRAQTYPHRRLLVWDTSAQPILKLSERWWDSEDVWYERALGARTIGELRNKANRIAAHDQFCRADIICHFDSDDWSHPRRIEEQVALMQATGKQCVGYRELLFWDQREELRDAAAPWTPRNEAWIYRNHQTNYACGASLMYRGELWEQQPFPDAPHEDQAWWLTPLVSGNCVGITSLAGFGVGAPLPPGADGPRMVCRIHGGNTEAYDRAMMLRVKDVFQRAPEFDVYAGKVMAL